MVGKEREPSKEREQVKRLNKRGQTVYYIIPAIKTDPVRRVVQTRIIARMREEKAEAK